MQFCHIAFVVSALLSTACSDVASPDVPPFKGEVVLRFEGEVPDGEERHFFLPFEVPPGVAEIEIRHDDLSARNILDWGLDDPNGFRGWGGGKEDPAILGREAASYSYLPGEIPAGIWEVVVGKALIEEHPARYAVEVVLRATPTLTPQPMRRPYLSSPALETGARWYSGDFHMHSLESDGSRSLEEVVALAERRGLDFLMVSEHNTTSHLSFYADLQARHPGILLIPGIEVTTYAGHANAIGVNGFVEHRTGTRGAKIEEAIESVHRQGGLFSINHPQMNLGNLCIGCGWQHEVDPQTIDAVEIRNAVFNGFDFWQELAAAGSHAAAIGGSDDHNAGTSTSPISTAIGTPTTLVYARELSVAGLLAGLREGRSVVQFHGPGGPMLVADLSGERLGDTVHADRSTLSVEVIDAGATTLNVYRNGILFDRVVVEGSVFTYRSEVEAPSGGTEDRFHFEVVRAGDVLAVASHVWLRASR